LIKLSTFYQKNGPIAKLFLTLFPLFLHIFRLFYEKKPYNIMRAIPQAFAMAFKPLLEKLRRYVYTVNNVKIIERGKAGECDEMSCVSI